MGTNRIEGVPEFPNSKLPRLKWGLQSSGLDTFSSSLPLSSLSGLFCFKSAKSKEQDLMKEIQ